jgi:hypothetical protein
VTSTKKRKPARGLSLLEVLISIFVIMVGLLGVAAVIPAGRAELVEAAKADRSSACGAAAQQFLLTATTPLQATAQPARYFDPRAWIYYYNSNYYLCAVTAQPGSVPNSLAILFSGQTTISGAPQFSPPFVVDPLYYARQAGVAGVNAFPIPTASGTTPVLRVSLPFLDPKSGKILPIQQPLAERFFLCQDDLVIPVPKDRTERPRQIMTDSSAKPLNVAVPTHNADALPTQPTTPFLVRQVQGDYSWLFTVNPLATQPDFINTGVTPPAFLNVGVGEYYSVSTAVFYKRNFNPDSTTSADTGEPFGTATFFSTPSLGGGDVTLSLASGSPAGWLDVRQGEWILLGGYAYPQPQASGTTIPRQYVLRWYRIVALGEINVQNKTLTRPATLAGPDWDLTDVSGNFGTADVVLYRGVVDVHTTTMKLTN